MRKIKKAGSVLKGEIILVRGLRWRVTKVIDLKKGVLHFDLQREEKDFYYYAGVSVSVDKPIEWVVTK